MPEVIEFEVAGRAYKARRMDAMTEESVMRKLAPLLNVAVPALASLKTAEGRVDLSVADIQAKIVGNALDPAKMIPVLTSTIAGLDDANARFVIGSTLSVCERQNGQAWGPVWSKSAHRPIADDIRTPIMYIIAAKVVGHAIQDFMAALAPSFSDGGAPASDLSRSISPTA